MNNLLWWPLLVPVAGLVVMLAIWWLYRLGRDVQIERARESFGLQRERLAEHFLLAANQAGKPKGLRWADAKMNGDLLLVRDRKSRKFSGLVSMDIRFEPTAETDLKEMEPATTPRTITAVYHYRQGEWVTEGRAIFNMSPEQALLNFESVESMENSKSNSSTVKN